MVASYAGVMRRQTSCVTTIHASNPLDIVASTEKNNNSSHAGHPAE